MTMRLTIIGGGTMGAAFAEVLLKREIVAGDQLSIVESNLPRMIDLRAQLGCCVDFEFGAVSTADVVVLAVKPQDFPNVADNIAAHLPANAVIISIMAGVSLAALARAFGAERPIARCMPNIALTVGAAMSTYVGSAALADMHCALVERILGAGGAVLRLRDESLMDAVTALTGSGPAYLFYVFEHLVKVACELGFSEQEAKLLLTHTAGGAIELWRQQECSLSELRAQVTSKGGTTEAALKVFIEAGVGAAFERAVRQATERAAELCRG